VTAVALPDHDSMVLNILSFYADSTSAERADGRAWYATALEASDNIARRTGVALDTVVAVVSVLSPQKEWNSNIAWAAECVEAWVAGRDLPRRGLGNSLRRAARALAGDRTDIMRQDNTLKVHNFYLSILGVPGAVCVDRHAIRVAMGDALLPSPPGLTDNVYRQVAEAYRDAARELRVGSRHVQAITWTVCKRRRVAVGAERA
jgi:hypothetical protein